MVENSLRGGIITASGNMGLDKRGKGSSTLRSIFMPAVGRYRGDLVCD
jgi:hypothetical protein